MSSCFGLRKHGLALWMFCVALAANGQPAVALDRADPTRVEAFAALPLLEMVQLSPDGQHLAAVLNREGRSSLVTATWDGRDMRAIMDTDNSKYQFSWIRWVNDKRLLASIEFPAIRPGAQTTETRLMAVDLDGSKLLNVVPPSRDWTIGIAQRQDRVIDFMPDDGEHILLALNEDRQVHAPGVYRVNVYSGKRELVLGPRDFVWQWIADRQHRVRVGVRQEGAKIEVIVCDLDGKAWRTLWKHEAFEGGSVWPIGFDRNPQILYVQASHEGRSAVFEARLDQLDASGRPALTLRQSDSVHDVDGGLIISRGSGEVLGISGVGESRAADYFWTEPLRELARGVDQALPQRYNRIYGFSQDENRYLVRSSFNALPPKIYVGDRSKGSLNLVSEVYPELANLNMTGKQAIKITARDGLVLHGYLSRPKTDAGGPGPLVLLPHGGPISRDSLDFDTWTEFLASRGYTVLQVNFRGSDGYGDDLRKAGLKRWGLEMQDDLTDAVQWTIQQKVADPNRICIVGASYGGYAALMGAVKTPDLYRCAMSFAGVTNLIDLSRHEASYVNMQAITDKQVGNHWNDRAQLKATSPSERAGEIKVPVLLMHGTADRSVPYDQAETMAKALKAAGRNFRLITMPDADHHLSRQSDRLLFFTELEKFLDAHIGASAKVARN